MTARRVKLIELNNPPPATIVAKELKKSKRVLKLGFWGDRDRRDLKGLCVQAGIV